MVVISNCYHRIGVVVVFYLVLVDYDVDAVLHPEFIFPFLDYASIRHGRAISQLTVSRVREYVCSTGFIHRLPAT